MEAYQHEIVRHSLPLNNRSDLKELIEQIKDKKVVMLGEASHGTIEYYEWRREITLELLKHHNFDFVAVEGDWPPCQKINSFIKGTVTLNAVQVLKSFDRWPTWMWANTEIAFLIDELKDLNRRKKKKVGFHGLDVYSLMESIDEVVRCLSKVDSHLVHLARVLYSCFEPYRHDEKEYARSLFHMPEGCTKEVTDVLEGILSFRLTQPDKEHFRFDALQNARIINNAEKYYRSMINIDDSSWNIRDNHMMETLSMLLDHYGKDSKGIVWEHNTHIGDYRATDMLASGDVNIGGLAREKYGSDKIALIGFGSSVGTVIASSAWDGPIQTLPLPKARTSSLESICHELIPEIGSSDFIISFKDLSKNSILSHEYKGHRAIGVVYHPEHERRGNYVPTLLGKRYDAFIYLDETHALTPLAVGFDSRKMPESWPYGSRI